MFMADKKVLSETERPKMQKSKWMMGGEIARAWGVHGPCIGYRVYTGHGRLSLVKEEACYLRDR